MADTIDEYQHDEHRQNGDHESSKQDTESIISSIDEPPSDNNNTKLIDNPFVRWRPSEIEGKIDRFAKLYGLQNQRDVLIKGAKINRDAEVWPSVANLTEDEKYALRHERKGFWHQPKELRVTIMTLCVAAIVQGWNQTAANGANLAWPYDFGICLDDNSPSCINLIRNTWIFASVNAVTFLSAGMIGCWLSDPLNEILFGRRAAICASALLIIAGAIGGAFTQDWKQLLACRIILGIGMGAKASVVPVFAAEVAPTHIRGSLVMNWQIFDAFGCFLGFSADLIAAKLGASSWRWQTASSALPTIILLSLIWVCPESPRFLMKHKQYPAAYRTLLAFRGEPILAAKELLYVHYQMEVETRMILQSQGVDPETSRSRVAATTTKPDQNMLARVRSSFWGHRQYSINYWQKFGQLFTVPRIRRAMVAAAVVMLAQQLSGTNVLQFYSSTFLKQASGTSGAPDRPGENNSSDFRSLWLSWGFVLSNFVFAFPAYWLIDSRGRRWLLLITIPFMALALLASSLSLQISDDSTKRGVFDLFIYIFQFFYSWGAGPVPFTLSAEVFPLENRVTGMSVSVFVNLTGAGLLTLFVPSLTHKLSPAGLCGLFAGLNVVAFVLVFLFVPETSGTSLGETAGSMVFMSLEELNYIFEVPTMKHIRYEFGIMLPWAWKRYIRRDPECPDAPQKLYRWAKPDDQQSEKHETSSEGV